MKDLIALVAVSSAIGFALGGLKSSAPPVEAPEIPAPPLPRAGVYTVTETASGTAVAPDEWTLSGCGSRCLRVLSTDVDGSWQLDLSWTPSADRHHGAWVGERLSPGEHCFVGAPDEYTTDPVPFKYVIRPDLTGFVNMKFTRDNPSCRGETGMRGQQLALTRAKAVWS
ncbi:hypothetical protein A5740_25755 [Mycobacterium sp. GA-1841]|uniref:hypothetical protein n=1 Tax=Mycobacterium sp. GA-1841 TaxID=1834154 RepID=UPI00096CB8D7|nr:hypothetical protein [Mycobacterium sp. GA-1841]OMC39838.1 hypothetical protein A5740_25755 [Mycobacterium sp. GA-1841]